MVHTGYNDLTNEERGVLLELAEDTISCGLNGVRYPDFSDRDHPPRLQQPGASFVTLYSEGQLRGCIGNLKASRILIEDVAHNAYAAAFEDPRFPPLSWNEFLDIKIEVSVLSPLENMEFDSEPNLLEQLRPGVDGLLLEVGTYRATFLPKVWNSLPGKEEFLGQLKCKAGLASDFWANTMRCSRYTTQSFSVDELKE